MGALKTCGLEVFVVDSVSVDLSVESALGDDFAVGDDASGV
jgi:hypothetical protein